MGNINFGKVNDLVKNISKDAKDEPEDYGTGLIGEQLIISAYKQMPVDKLEKMRHIMNKVIKKKKEMKRINQNKCLPKT